MTQNTLKLYLGSILCGVILLFLETLKRAEMQQGQWFALTKWAMGKRFNELKNNEFIIIIGIN